MDRKPVQKHVEFYSKNKFEKLVHSVGFIIRIYQDARSSDCQILRAQLLIITLKLYCFGYFNLTNLNLEFTDPKIIKLFVNA